MRTYVRAPEDQWQTYASLYVLTLRTYVCNALALCTGQFSIEDHIDTNLRQYEDLWGPTYEDLEVQGTGEMRRRMRNYESVCGPSDLRMRNEKPVSQVNVHMLCQRILRIPCFAYGASQKLWCALAHSYGMVHRLSLFTILNTVQFIKTVLFCMRNTRCSFIRSISSDRRNS